MAAVARRDFADVVNMIFGNLNGSHLGFRGGPDNRPNENTGLLGIVFDNEYDGPGLKVDKVYKESPADMIASKVEAGEVVLSIDGVEVSREVNTAKLLADVVGDKVSLIVAKGDDLENKRRVILRTASGWTARSWLYEEFVEAARKKTHELSDGRIGYLHIQSMGQPSLERFEMELYSEAFDKDAIVIDVRNNGGGWTTDMLLTILEVSDHAWTQARGADVKGYPQDRRPLYSWTKPIIVLCNEYSYSNAEIFSWAIKTLGRGKVVGQQTFGAVISTGGYGMIDGSYVRTPFRGWYVKGSDINQELNGCPPDIVVEYQPGDSAKGIDRQLEVAVKELLKELQ
jgi:tricorn protease